MFEMHWAVMILIIIGCFFIGWLSGLISAADEWEKWNDEEGRKR